MHVAEELDRFLGQLDVEAEPGARVPVAEVAEVALAREPDQATGDELAGDGGVRVVRRRVIRSLRAGG